MKKKCMQNGRSMIEMLGVLAIIGILTVGGFNLVMKAQTHQKINEVTDNLTTLARKVRVVARDYTGAAGSLNSYVDTGRAFPDSLKYDASKGFTDRNDITYNVRYIGEGGAILFVIGVSGLTTEMCMNMVNANYGNKATSGFVGMSVGDANITDAATAIQAGTAKNVAIPPATITLDKAATLCTDGVAMYFAFR
jgi:type II secretory pathway pseudopilin PulG